MTLKKPPPDVPPYVSRATHALTSSWDAFLLASTGAPSSAGLYAVHASARGLKDLDLPPGASLLYVGKAERNLVSLDIRTHFTSGKTGSSTLRRSLAGLLREQLSLVGVPRNFQKPDGSANFGLEIEGDQRLTTWMRGELGLAFWPKADRAPALKRIEKRVIWDLDPPLNLTHVPEPRRDLRALRGALAAEARGYKA